MPFFFFGFPDSEGSSSLGPARDDSRSEIEGMVSHSWYLEDKVWYDDLAYTLAGRIDRIAIPTRSRVAENDFVLKAEG